MGVKLTQRTRGFFSARGGDTREKPVGKRRVRARVREGSGAARGDAGHAVSSPCRGSLTQRRKVHGKLRLSGGQLWGTVLPPRSSRRDGHLADTCAGEGAISWLNPGSSSFLGACLLPTGRPAGHTDVLQACGVSGWRRGVNCKAGRPGQTGPLSHVRQWGHRTIPSRLGRSRLLVLRPHPTPAGSTVVVLRVSSPVTRDTAC